MLSPFPGMNPCLEHHALWSEVHKRLIVAIADALFPKLSLFCHSPRIRMKK
ncbi:MAG: DUF4058 family protein [Symplocastrum torsivum CPER-KK1]|uniref:DUF4058 family protein n=1 Tax=Symplocastrum torsivum CPER-KK1 TaxID=450513 RepID=A0A951U9J3_9CYAN|nr:DUF4058 family protein [Symplocastrum torsivum CPER-KK1]